MQIITFPLNAAISHPVLVTKTAVQQGKTKSFNLTFLLGAESTENYCSHKQFSVDGGKTTERCFSPH